MKIEREGGRRRCSKTYTQCRSAKAILFFLPMQDSSCLAKEEPQSCSFSSSFVVTQVKKQHVFLASLWTLDGNLNPKLTAKYGDSGYDTFRVSFWTLQGILPKKCVAVSQKTFKSKVARISEILRTLALSSKHTQRASWNVNHWRRLKLRF